MCVRVCPSCMCISCLAVAAQLLKWHCHSRSLCSDITQPLRQNNCRSSLVKQPQLNIHTVKPPAPSVTQTDRVNPGETLNPSAISAIANIKVRFRWKLWFLPFSSVRLQQKIIARRWDHCDFSYQLSARVCKTLNSGSWDLWKDVQIYTCKLNKLHLKMVLDFSDTVANSLMTV